MRLWPRLAATIAGSCAAVTAISVAALAATPAAAEPADDPSSDAAEQAASTPPAVGISANPGAVNVTTGTGWLGRTLHADAIPGVRLGGLWIGDVNFLLDGGVDPGTTADGLLIVDLSIDLDQAIGIPGADFGAEFLQFNGDDTNGDAGVVTGYNSLIAAPPFDRTELYQLWWRQRLLDDLLVVRVGKSVPTYDFGNVSRAVPVGGPSGFIPSVSGLIYTPLFVNPTTLGVMPGYYDSAYGVTVSVVPDDSFYTNLGIYDGNLARGVHTGQTFTPDFTGYYFGAGEAGYSWLLGRHDMPGKLAAGGWLQTGELEADGIREDGT